ncbi:MAG: hypothetical protein IH626_22510 [Rhodospirillales bacterium]|nr:hypothetical protein [Rhodospirillales bacterium]
MTGIADKIMRRARSRGRGRWVCAAKDFLDLGGRAAVDQALSRLMKAGKLRRVGRGLYDLPRMSRILGSPAPVDIDAAVAAVARRDSIRIMPDGMVAANQLGLTNAVPARASFITDGATRTVKIGGGTIRLRHAGPGVMHWAGKRSAPVFLALRWLGRRAGQDPRVAAILCRRLPDDVKRDLSRHSRHLPGWAAPIARAVAGGRTAAA